MKDYSQNGEQWKILERFKGWETGNALDVGANDGITLSNTYALLMQGWDVHYVEPNPTARRELERNMVDHGDKTRIFPCGLTGKETHMGTLYTNGAHAPGQYGPNVGLLSTTDPKQKERWRGESWGECTAEFKSFKDFIEDQDNAPFYDFISIDAEGMDFEIIEAISNYREGLWLTNCTLLCIEWNQEEGMKWALSGMLEPFGLTLCHETYENLLFKR